MVNIALLPALASVLGRSRLKTVHWTVFAPHAARAGPPLTLADWLRDKAKAG
jgi:hypothetical protein